jgi:septation ring formation regulator EzrA
MGFIDKDILNIILGYLILSIPAFLVLYFFKRKSKKELQKLENTMYKSERDTSEID